MFKKHKSTNGITLIALVITIIILLILAGISISQLTGSGLFENAREAEEKSKNAQAEENSILDNYEQWMENYLGNQTVVVQPLEGLEIADADKNITL